MTWPPPPIPESHPIPPPPRAARTPRRLALVGLTAGLLAGGAVGLVAVSPLAAGAANDAPPVVGEGPVRHGDRVRDALQPLVDDGTLTPEQLDAVIAALDEARPSFDGAGGPWLRHRLHDCDELAALFGVNVEDLREQLRGGTALADIAADHGVDVDTVIDVLVADAEARLDEAVADGRLTEDEAAEHAARLRERVSARVNGERPAFPDLPDGPGRLRPGFPDLVDPDDRA